MKYTFIIISVLFFGCTSNNNKLNTFASKVSVNVEEIRRESFSAEEIIDDLYYIPLQTIDTINLIGKIDRVLFIDSSILVLDRDISKKVLMFSNKGKFERMIGSFGEGPGQYKKPQDIYYDTTSTNIIIYCRHNRKLLFYKPDGKFILEKYIGLDFRSFVKFKNKYMCFTHKLFNETPEHGYLPYDYIVFDTLGSIYYTHFNNSIKTGVSGVVLTHNNYFSKDKDGFLISWTFNDTIYGILEDCSIEPRFYFDFGRKRLPKKLIDQESMNIYREVLLDGKYYSKYSPLICNNLQKAILVSAGKSDKNESNLYTLIMSNDHAKKILFKEIRYSDNCTYSFPLTGCKDFFVSVMYPDQIYLDIKDQSDFRLEGINSKINEFDNPILVFYKFKLS